MEKTRFEEFCETCFNDPEKYRDGIKGNGGFEYREQVTRLIELSNKLNARLLIYMFGERVGIWLAHKFVIECNKNLLHFFAKIDDDKRFYILHELKTNEVLFAHC